ncbi:hypothetical protein GUITHDRAFT_115092 [Guillardia theta CCMP2712]|uniref:Tyrosine-protein kinase ephrin type A/B receptor-like domain-containing protein n=1 Tax=Guillardia theta (strain CCMP2712) TaxID=905079 RepID=L1ISA4_GUITC|nr:hypothetical protein GUITHDRAFT_115092 [Guillardia theta CCMP2712]EKX38764.1 hypothetical protein GUITHDRAFT_115092 [Guillardia theta CCMP2712]|eukprot:XP_005825744.1 hypothetical protein GUITHDRAFT_115092 [Guillardia theta CCMP2712]
MMQLKMLIIVVIWFASAAAAESDEILSRAESSDSQSIHDAPANRMMEIRDRIARDSQDSKKHVHALSKQRSLDRSASLSSARPRSRLNSAQVSHAQVSELSLLDNSQAPGDDMERLGDSLPSIVYGGRKYATLDGAYYQSQRTDTSQDCQTRAMRLPKSWAVAPDDQTSRDVIGMYTWGTTSMVVNSGNSYPTNCMYCSYSHNNLEQSSDGLYWPQYCNSRILIVYVGCPPGQTREFCSSMFRDSAESKPAAAHFYGPTNSSILNTTYLKPDPTSGRNWSYILPPTSVDDSSWLVPNLGFPFCIFGGNQQTSVFVSSNSFITFGGGSSAYSSLSATNPWYPTLFVGAGDTSAQLIVGSPIREDNMDAYVIRFEGTSSTSGQPGNPNLIFEVTFFANNTLRVAVGRQDIYFSTMYMMSDGMGTTLTTFDPRVGQPVLIVSGVPSSNILINLPCVTCSNITIPEHALYSPLPSGAPETCSWICEPGFYLQDGTCIECTGKPMNATYANDQCGWLCDVGFYKSGSMCWPCLNRPANAVFVSAGQQLGSDSCAWQEVAQESGYVFSTLGGYGPYSQYSTWGCLSDNAEYLPLPASWVVAPDDELSINVTAKYDWGALRLVLDSGSSYYTNSILNDISGPSWYWDMMYYWSTPGNRDYYQNALTTYDGVYYRSTDCDARVLIRAPMCAAGYQPADPEGLKESANMSQCVPCSNEIPAGAEYVLSPYAQQLSSCGWSCKVGYYPTGSTCSQCAGKPSLAVYTGAGLQSKPDSCSWSCLPGYHKVDGWSCETCTDALPSNAHWEGSDCAWACDFGYRLNSSNVCEDISIYLDGQRYASLDGRGPHDSSLCVWNGAREIPAGWLLAPDTSASVAVASQYTWGSNLVVLADGKAWNSMYGSYCCSSQLHNYQDKFFSTESCSTVLVVAEDCLAGYHRDPNNLTQCVACSNYKPAHAFYNSSGFPASKNNCKWQCDVGYYPDASVTTCIPCSSAPQNSIYTSSNGDCAWTCRAGFYLQDTSCKACRTILPDFAYFIAGADNSQTCQWACRFGYMQVGGRCVGLEYSGRYYATLSGRGPNDPYTCENNPYMAIPQGWELAPNTQDSQYVTWLYPWGSNALFLADGTEWCTARNSQTSPSRCWWSSMVSYNGMYKSNGCDQAILLRSIDCASGYSQSGSSCVPCSNSIPANASYGALEQVGGTTSFSSCGYTCDAGFYMQGGTCVHCNQLVLPANAEYVRLTIRASSQYECQWRCMAGYYLKAGQCVACEEVKPVRAHWLVEGTNGTMCGWACDFGSYSSADGDCRPLQAYGRYYAALDGSSPYSYSGGCDGNELRAIPAGWQIAPNTMESQMTVWMHGWDNCLLMLADGSSWQTSSCWQQTSSPQSQCCYSLISYDGMYRSSYGCSGSVLLVSESCAAGYYFHNGTNCSSCANPIPPHAVYAQQLDPSRYSDSVCPWECEPGYVRRGEACEACGTAPGNAEYVSYGPGGLNGSWTECGWRCMAGYYLKAGQCVACEEVKPVRAHWLVEGTNGTMCGWACDFGSYSSADGDCRPLQAYGRYYAALDGSSPYSYSGGCDGNELRAIPAGWQIAPNTMESQMTVWMHGWDNCLLMLADGSSWQTSSCWQQTSSPQSQCCYSLISYDGMYRSSYGCSGSVLLVSESCAAGYYFHNGTNCSSCANPIPPHAVYAQQLDPSRYSDSVCPWECEPGYVRRGEACEACGTAPGNAEYVSYGPGGLNGSWTECGWRCMAGYYLKAGQCVACEEVKPVRAHWLVEGTNGTMCGWACDFGSFQRISQGPNNKPVVSCEMFQYGNRYYATLYSHSPEDTRQCTSDMRFRSIPAGFMIAPNTMDSEMVTATQRWGVCRLQLSDGSLWQTSNCACCNSPSFYMNSLLISRGDQYRAWDSCSDILLVSLFCSPGFYLSGSSCVSCTNPIPANASYAAASNPGQYADSKCPWQCDAGFYQSSEWMVCLPCTNSIPKFAFYSTAGLVDQPESCQWACANNLSYGAGCNVSRSHDLEHEVSYKGRVFASFDDVAPTSLNRSCQRDGSMLQQPPLGWVVAPWSEDAVRVIASYPWGARGMVLADSVAYQTGRMYEDYMGYYTPGTVVSDYAMYRSGNSYALMYCDNQFWALRILLVRLDCAEGYQGRGDQNCTPCSQLLPANAVASSGPNGCGWTCQAGYFKSYDACSACNPRYPKPENAVYVESDDASGVVCPWRCGLGHYRSYGSCLPCMNKPNMAYFLSSSSEECSWRCQPGYYRLGMQCLPCSNPLSAEDGVILRPGSVLCNVTSSCSASSWQGSSYQCGWIYAVTSESGDEYAVLVDNMTTPWDPLQGPISTPNQMLQCGMVQLPAGWQVAPNDTDAAGVVTRYPWGLRRLVVADGTVYSTFNDDSMVPGSISQLSGLTKSIRTDAELYSLSPGVNCHDTRILIKKIRCNPGEYISGSSCRTCSNPVCRSGEHALPCSEFQDSVCSSAVQPCRGKCNCQLYQAATGSMSDGSAMSSLYDDGSSCRWLIQPAGASSIKIDFTSFALEAGYDFVTVNQCIGLAAPNLECIGSTELVKLTGTPELGSLTYTSSYGIIEIVFQTDESVAYQGFTMTWTANISSNALSRYWFVKSQYLDCRMQHSWQDIVEGLSVQNKTFAMGGLGELMIRGELEVWVCTLADACSLPGDAFCYIYDEQREVFVPWDKNSNLKLVE